MRFIVMFVTAVSVLFLKNYMIKLVLIVHIKFLGILDSLSLN